MELNILDDGCQKRQRDALGGQIRFKSQENKGSTFIITLPLVGSKAKKGETTIAS